MEHRTVNARGKVRVMLMASPSPPPSHTHTRARTRTAGFTAILVVHRCAHGLAMAYDMDCMYAVGGYGGQGRYLDSVECLSVSAGTDARWLSLPPLSCKRAGCVAAVGPDRRVYCVGGGPDGQTAHRSMEAYDARTSTWDASLTPPTIDRHYNAAAFGPDGRLYVSGAFRHTGQLDAVEAYDVRADRWETLPEIGVVVQFSAGAFLY